MFFVEFGPCGMLGFVCEIRLGAFVVSMCIDSYIRAIQVGRGAMAHVLNLRFGIELYRAREALDHGCVFGFSPKYVCRRQNQHPRIASNIL